MKKLVFSAVKSMVFVLVATFANAESHYISGTISNLTVTTQGIMIMVSGGLPDNCLGSPWGWMLIKQENTALTAVVLASWVKGSTQGTFYTSAAVSSRYCTVNQFDPAG